MSGGEELVSDISRGIPAPEFPRKSLNLLFQGDHQVYMYTPAEVLK